jgi:hypothetical protein
MKAHVKRKQLYRRVTIILIVAAVTVTLVVGFYFAYTAANRFSDLIGKPVSSSDITSLQQLSRSPYGPSGAALISQVKTSTDIPYATGGKPILVYIGADYCMYCAAQRWPLVLSLMRFGNFTGLGYMASGVSEGDYATFTFHGSSYSSRYIVFQSFENRDRNDQPLDNIPTNYTGPFSTYGSAYPFLNFGNKYIVTGALLDPSLLTGKDFQGVFSDIRSNSTLGTQVKEVANVFTSLICKLTGNQPQSVCNQAPINGMTFQIAAYGPLQGLSVQIDALQVSTSTTAERSDLSN